jgi:VWFA-related protein
MNGNQIGIGRAAALVAFVLACFTISQLFAFPGSVAAQSGRKQPTQPRQYDKPKPKPTEPATTPTTPTEPKPGETPGDKPKPKDSGDNGQDGQDDGIKIETQLVSVPFTATDKRNRYINDLAKENIQVFEDGKPQEIFSFVRESDQPLTFAILFDVSGSQQYSIPQQREAASLFFQRIMRPDKDLAAIVTFRRDIEVRQKLTSNVRSISRALDDIRFDEGSAQSRGGTPPVILDPGISGTSLYDAVYLTADEMLSREAGRRVIIILTDGEDTTSQYKRDQASDMALRNEAQVYVIGIPGAAPNGYGGYNYGGVNRGDMIKMCEATGGRAFFPQRESDYIAAFRQIEEDLRQQYIVSYSPENTNRDGNFRAISIKVNRPDAKDLRVLTRKGYYAK